MKHLLVAAALLLTICSNTATAQTKPTVAENLTRPFPYTDTKEEVWLDYGKRTVRLQGDITISNGATNKRNCFIVINSSRCGEGQAQLLYRNVEERLLPLCL